MTRRADALSRLPPQLAPRGICREAAAEFVGVSVTKFDQMVSDGRMPPARRVDGRRVWDVRELDAAFSRLPHEGPAADPDADPVLSGLN